jgi:hypothetical protein
MSTTAGVGAQEYVAINPVAIAALFLGVGSVLVLLSNLFLVIPAIGFVCGIIALVQIRHSNGTQTGIGLASLGLLLCLAFGGGKGGYELVGNLRTTSDEREVAHLMQQLGQDLTAKDYQKAYARFSSRFRDRVDLATFTQTLRGFDEAGPLGALQSIEWNGQRMYMERQPDSNVMFAYGMALFKYSGNPEPRRVVITAERSGDVWRLYDVEGLFPKPKKQLR